MIEATGTKNAAYFSYPCRCAKPLGRCMQFWDSAQRKWNL